MKVKVQQSKTILLKLEEDEAKWLKGVFQNCLVGNPDEESIEEQEMRMRFWNALENIV